MSIIKYVQWQKLYVFLSCIQVNTQVNVNNIMYNNIYNIQKSKNPLFSENYILIVSNKEMNYLQIVDNNNNQMQK